VQGSSAVTRSLRTHPPNSGYGRAWQPRISQPVDAARLTWRAPSRESLDFAQILDVLAAAITIRDPGDQIVYANRAALDDMGFATLAELQSRPLRSIMADYSVLDELGRKLSMADIPSVKLLRGERGVRADPLLMRTVRRSSGELEWKRLKATRLIDESGEMVATVRIIEDVTEVKNAEPISSTRPAREHDEVSDAALERAARRCARSG
jgi:PAS domain S-box-containing protein